MFPTLKLFAPHFAIFLFPVLIATVEHGGAAVYLLIVILGLFFGWSSWQNLEYLEKKILIGFFCFFVLVCLSLINTQDMDYAMNKLEKFFLFPLFMPMYLLIRKYRNDTSKTFLFGILASSIVMFAQAYYQTEYVGYLRAKGAYNSLILGSMAMYFTVIIVCAMFTCINEKKFQLLAVIPISLCFAASIMSGSRGAWLLVPIIMPWLLWMNRKKLSKLTLFTILFLILGLIWGLLGLDIVEKRVDRALSSFADYLDKKNVDKLNSVNARINMWEDSITIWVSHPIIGTGIGDFKMDSELLFKEGRSKMSKAHGHAHNIYFDALATTGLIGFFALIIIVQIMPFKLFYNCWVNEDGEWVRFCALAGMATIIAFSVFGLTEGWFSRNSFVRTYLFSLLVFMSSIYIKKVKKAETLLRS